jgi:hypothetical protein
MLETLEVRMRTSFLSLAFLSVASLAFAQLPDAMLSGLTRPQDYTLKRISSFDPSGGNGDARPIAAGQTLVLADQAGPGLISHIWITISSPERYHLKKLVLRMYWDDETTPSVETPIGDFFGLGLGEYFQYQAYPLAVAPDKALNSFFPMPFQRRARITVTNEGQRTVGSFYFNIDCRVYRAPLAADTLYFHAQYRQASPAKGWTSDWNGNGDANVNTRPNLKGEDNYVWMEATGRGHFAGVTMSVLQNQDFWWGEGDDMFFIDGETTPSITGTGSEDYFLGAWDFGDRAFSYGLFGAPVKGEERAGSRSSVYRFHLDSPIPFSRSLRATIEHGHANHRSDNFFSVAYWYQTEPHARFPELPAVDLRLPRLHAVGGPGSPGK